MANGSDMQKKQKAALERSAYPAAYEEALSGKRGWGLTRADVALIATVGALVLALCCVLWFGYGVEGVPGVSSGPAEPGSGEVEQGELVDAAWAPSAPQVEVDGGSMGVSAGEAGEEGLVAVIQNSAGFVQVLPLDTNTQVTVVGELGANVIEVRGGSVRCIESDCANQVCVDTGWVSGVGQMIVCLPHKLTVQVVRNAEDAAPLA